MSPSPLLLKKLSLLFLLVSASFLSVSFAGRPSKMMNVEDKYDQEIRNKGLEEEEEEVGRISERVLKANTGDYGRYDPPPALVKPPFKLIPN